MYIMLLFIVVLIRYNLFG